MTKAKTMSKVRYEPPEVEVFHLGLPLDFLESFSTQSGGNDWNEGDLLDSELGEVAGGTDWGLGGGLNTD